MAGFIVRIELHDANSNDYNKLHKAMELENFTRTIVSDKGTEYNLPTAEYSFVSNTLTTQDVKKLAASVANKIVKKSSVLAINYSSLSWTGLDKA